MALKVDKPDRSQGSKSSSSGSRERVGKREELPKDHSPFRSRKRREPPEEISAKHYVISIFASLLYCILFAVALYSGIDFYVKKTSLFVPTLNFDKLYLSLNEKQRISNQLTIYYLGHRSYPKTLEVLANTNYLTKSDLKYPFDYEYRFIEGDKGPIVINPVK